jgi:histidine triad (HIT) family protein
LNNEITIFEKILAGEIPSTIVYENEHVVAFKDIIPKAPVHVLVIPRKKSRNLTEIAGVPETEIGHFLKGVALTATALGLDDSGYRVVINNGRDGQQSVEYLHAHILGGRPLKWPPG